MTLEDNKNVVRRFYDALNLGDAKVASGFWAPGAMNHGKAVEHPAIQRLMEDIVSIHEHIELNEMVAEGDWVACRMIVSGRHKVRPSIPFDSGIYNLTEPAGLPFTAQHMHMFRIADGKIKEHWATRDDLGAARQLGLDLKPI